MSRNNKKLQTVTAVLVLLALYSTSWYHYLLFHSLPAVSFAGGAL